MKSSFGFKESNPLHTPGVPGQGSWKSGRVGCTTRTTWRSGVSGAPVERKEIGDVRTKGGLYGNREEVEG